MINRYYTRTPYEGELYSPNVALVGQVLEAAQKQYDTNFLVAEELKNKTLNALPVDRLRADEITKAYQTRIDDVVNKYSGDYSQATKDLYRLKTDIQKDFSPGGEAAAIESNYKNYYERLKEEQERLKKKEIHADQISMWSNYTLGNYTGVGKKDPISGSYNILEPESIAEYVDPNAIVEDIFKNTPELEREVGRERFENGLKIYQKERVKGKTFDQLQPAFKVGLTSNSKYMDYLSQNYKFQGVDPERSQEVAVNYVDAISNRWAQLKQYENRFDDQRVDRDPLYLQNLRHKQSMDRIKYSRQLRKQDEEEAERRAMSLRMGDALNTPNGQKIPTDWKSSKAVMTGDYGAFGALANTVGSWFGDVVGGAIDQVASPGTVYPSRTKLGNFFRITKSYDAGNLYDAVSNGNLKTLYPNTNEGLLNATFGKIATQKGKDWSKMSPSEQRTFVSIHEKEILSDYNADLDDLQVAITDEFAIPEKAGNVLKQQLLPLAKAGGTSVFQIKSGKLEEFAKLGEIGVETDDIFDKDGKIKSGVKVSSYVVPGQGFTKPAYKVVTPSGKSFYITDSDRTRYTGFSNFAESLRPILENGAALGLPFSDLTVNGQQISVVPKLNYNYEGSKVKKEIEYYYIDPETKEMKLLPNMRGDGKATTYDMWEMMNSQIKSALPLGASKSDFRKFDFDYNIDEDEE